MDKMVQYLIKKNPSRLIFLDGIAIIPYNRRADIFDLETGVLMDSIAVRYLSQAILCNRYRRLFLKSVMGPVYSYHFETKELQKICSIGHGDNGMFLSADQEYLIVFTQLGKTWRIETKSATKTDFYKSCEEGFHQYGWDDVSDGCYKLLCFPQPQRKPTITRIDKKGKLLSSDVVTVHGDDIILHYFSYDPANRMYIFQYTYPCTAEDDFEDWNIFENINSLEDLKQLSFEDDGDHDTTEYCLSVGFGSVENQRLILKDVSTGGPPCCEVWSSILFASFGNTKIYVIDLASCRILKELMVDTPVFSMQYDSYRNVLFAVCDRMVYIPDIL